MKNVITDAGEEINDNGGNQSNWLIINQLKTILPNFDDYLFIIYGHNGANLPISRTFQHKKKILFWEGGECKRQQFDKIISDYHLIFSHYSKNYKNVYSLPLGHFNIAPTAKPIEMSERLCNIVFTGCLNRNRCELAKNLSGIQKKWILFGMSVNKKWMLKILNTILYWKYPRDFFMFNGDFNSGLDSFMYSYYLKNAKVALCPRGWINAETFRLFEAMCFGCAVICEKLPDREYYKNIPVIQIDNWDDGIKIAKDLITKPDQLEISGQKNRLFYNEHFSVIAGAEYIKKIMLNSDHERR